MYPGEGEHGDFRHPPGAHSLVPHLSSPASTPLPHLDPNPKPHHHKSQAHATAERHISGASVAMSKPRAEITSEGWQELPVRRRGSEAVRKRRRGATETGTQVRVRHTRVRRRAKGQQHWRCSSLLTTAAHLPQGRRHARTRARTSLSPLPPLPLSPSRCFSLTHPASPLSRYLRACIHLNAALLEMNEHREREGQRPARHCPTACRRLCFGYASSMCKRITAHLPNL